MATKNEVGVHVLRKDGRPLSAVDLAACEAAFPRHAVKARAKKPARMLACLDNPLFSLGLNKDGTPRHPLYLAASTPLVPWSGAAQ